MQKFVFLFIAAFAALLGLVSPVQGLAAVRRETNAERFARGMPPLPPRFSTRTLTALRRRPSHGVQLPETYSGRIEVRSAADDSVIGFVANVPGSDAFGLYNLDHPDNHDLHVEYSDSSLRITDDGFDGSPYIGGNGSDDLIHDSSATVSCSNVPLGQSATIWNLDNDTRELTILSWINSDGSSVQPDIVYLPGQNQLVFAGDVDQLLNSQDPSQVVHVTLHMED